MLEKKEDKFSFTKRRILNIMGEDTEPKKKLTIIIVFSLLIVMAIILYLISELIHNNTTKPAYSGQLIWIDEDKCAVDVMVNGLFQTFYCEIDLKLSPDVDIEKERFDFYILHNGKSEQIRAVDVEYSFFPYRAMILIENTKTDSIRFILKKPKSISKDQIMFGLVELEIGSVELDKINASRPDNFRLIYVK